MQTDMQLQFFEAYSDKFSVDIKARSQRRNGDNRKASVLLRWSGFTRLEYRPAESSRGHVGEACSPSNGAHRRCSPVETGNWWVGASTSSTGRSITGCQVEIVTVK